MFGAKLDKPMFATLPQAIISLKARAKTLNLPGLIGYIIRVVMKDTALQHHTKAWFNIIPSEEFRIFNVLQQETDLTAFEP